MRIVGEYDAQAVHGKSSGVERADVHAMTIRKLTRGR